MNKNIVKTETMAEFLARGGAVKKVAAKGAKKTITKVMDEAELDQEIDFDALPMALKIKYGVR